MHGENSRRWPNEVPRCDKNTAMLRGEGRGAPGRGRWSLVGSVVGAATTARPLRRSAAAADETDGQAALWELGQ